MLWMIFASWSSDFQRVNIRDESQSQQLLSTPFLVKSSYLCCLFQKLHFYTVYPDTGSIFYTPIYSSIDKHRYGIYCNVLEHGQNNLFIVQKTILPTTIFDKRLQFMFNLN